MTGERPLDVLIAGAGHAGLLLGGALAARGLDVEIVDPAPPPLDVEAVADGRTLALMRGSRDALERLGAWPALDASVSPVRGAEVVDVAGNGRVGYRPASADEPPFAYGIRNAELRRLLGRWFVERAGADRIRRAAVTSLNRAASAVAVGLGDGSTRSARLLVGADGRGSAIRRLAAIGLDAWDYPQAAIACVVRHELPHDDMVRERLRPAGPLALLPVGEGMCGVTWVESRATAATLARLEPAALAERLRTETANALGHLEIVGPVGVWPLGAQHARRYVGPRLALVGDAAHGVHPIHAQGFNMGVGDIAALTDLIARDPGDPGALLAYERRRRGLNRRRLWLTDGLNRLFTVDLPAVRTARGLGLRLLDGVAPLRDLAVRTGSYA